MFAIIGWLLLVIISFICTVCGPALFMGLSQLSGGPGGWKVGIIPFSVGSVALYFLFTHIPFHITLS